MPEDATPPTPPSGEAGANDLAARVARLESVLAQMLASPAALSMDPALAEQLRGQLDPSIPSVL